MERENVTKVIMKGRKKTAKKWSTYSYEVLLKLIYEEKKREPNTPLKIIPKSHFLMMQQHKKGENKQNKEQIFVDINGGKAHLKRKGQ